MYSIYVKLIILCKGENTMYNAFDLSYYQELPEQVFTEAVFVQGKARIKPIEDNFRIVRDILIKEVNENGSKFNPQKYWKNKAWKDLEDALNETFGFRYASIQPYKEKWLSKEKMFESKQLNACVWSEKRFPIDGLVTEKGFYDKTHSTRINVYITLGLIKALEPDEITAVLLHEFGHAIDPALVDITYQETNILSKYLTDRKKEITPKEQKVIKHTETQANWTPGILTFFTKLLPATLHGVKSFGIFGSSEEKNKKAIDNLKKVVDADKDKFDHVHMMEAYADNYARMYGYGPQLARGLAKLDKERNNQINSWTKREGMRRNIIVHITTAMINDVHKTDIHRYRAMIKEMKKDLEDPNIPDKVKEQMRQDIAEIEKVIDEYCNNRGEFQNRVNKMINEELIAAEKAEGAKSKANSNDTTEKTPEKKAAIVKESAEGFIESVDTTLNVPSILEAFSVKLPEASEKDNKLAKRHFISLEKSNKKPKRWFSIFGKKEEKEKKECKIPEGRINEAVKHAYDELIAPLSRKSIEFVKSDGKVDDPKINKIGGTPYWPVIKLNEWPKYNDKPMYCMCQVNFADLPHLEDYPTTGILQFFAGDDDTCEHKGSTKVVYWEDSSDESIKPSDVPSVDYEPISYAGPDEFTTFTGKLVDTTPGLYDISVGLYDKFIDIITSDLSIERVDGIYKLPTEVREVIYKIPLPYGSRIGGWYSWTQSPVYDETDKDIVQLIQLDSDLGMMWGDMGIAHFFLTKDQLKKLDFDKADFCWDCG